MRRKSFGANVVRCAAALGVLFAIAAGLAWPVTAQPVMPLLPLFPVSGSAGVPQPQPVPAPIDSVRTGSSEGGPHIGIDSGSAGSGSRWPDTWSSNGSGSGSSGLAARPDGGGPEAGVLAGGAPATGSPDDTVRGGGSDVGSTAACSANALGDAVALTGPVRGSGSSGSFGGEPAAIGSFGRGPALIGGSGSGPGSIIAGGASGVALGCLALLLPSPAPVPGIQLRVSPPAPPVPVTVPTEPLPEQIPVLPVITPRPAAGPAPETLPETAADPGAFDVPELFTVLVVAVFAAHGGATVVVRRSRR